MRFSNFSSESQILQRPEATPLGMFSKLLLGKHVIGKAYVNIWTYEHMHLFPRTAKQNQCSKEEWNRKCDTCKNFLVVSADYTCFGTKWKYKIKGILKCHSGNIIDLISYKCCGKQNIGTANGFKECFRIHKSDISTGKVRCGVVNHFLNVCRSSARKFEYLEIRLIEKVSVQNDDDIDKVSWGKRKILTNAIV